MAQRSVHPIAHDSLSESRLAFKRAFVRYYLALLTPAIADPTEVFEAGYEYLATLLEQLGPVEFMKRLDDETIHFAGQAEQEIRRHLRDRREPVAVDDLEDRVRECFEVALDRLGPRARRRERRAPRG